MQAALEELRAQPGGDRVALSELVILGAREKAAQLRAERDDTAARRRRLADAVREGSRPVDPEAAAEVRRAGWARDPAAG